MKRNRGFQSALIGYDICVTIFAQAANLLVASPKKKRIEEFVFCSAIFAKQLVSLYGFCRTVVITASFRFF